MDLDLFEYCQQFNNTRIPLHTCEILVFYTKLLQYAAEMGVNEE